MVLRRTPASYWSMLQQMRGDANGVAAKCEAVHAGTMADGGLRGAWARADRKPAPQALRDRHNVGRDPGPFMREQFAGAAHPALHLVIDEDQPVLVADRAQP